MLGLDSCLEVPTGGEEQRADSSARARATPIGRASTMEMAGMGPRFLLFAAGGDNPPKRWLNGRLSLAGSRCSTSVTRVRVGELCRHETVVSRRFARFVEERDRRVTDTARQ